MIWAHCHAPLRASFVPLYEALSLIVILERSASVKFLVLAPDELHLFSRDEHGIHFFFFETIPGSALEGFPCPIFQCGFGRASSRDTPA